MFYFCLNCLNKEEPSIKVDPEFEEFLKRFEKADTVDESIEILKERLSPEEIAEIKEQWFQSIEQEIERRAKLGEVQ